MLTRIFIATILMMPQQRFKDSQVAHERVRSAYSEKEAVVKRYFSEKKHEYKNFQLYLRAFKQEEQLEVWVKAPDEKQYCLLHTYTICARSGELGPKRREGDYQVPEGAYKINHFNPQSSYYLSLGLSYPNASDKILSDKIRPGGQIYIHGNCVTIGCLPLTDDKIKELYVMAIEAKSHGQQDIPVHVFPARLNNSSLQDIAKLYPHHSEFWKNLQVVYNDFEKNHELREPHVDKHGRYYY